MTRWQWIITGAVQGVGFRPFVYKTAHQAGVSGHISNTDQGVAVEIQGTEEQLAHFAALFAAHLPPLARILDQSSTTLPPVPDEAEFVIRPSTGGASHQVLISPDVATCAECVRDLSDPTNRRFGYPFTNCTNCGPRYTITRSIPYDRASTSMHCFPLCPDCQAEYNNPLDRRFHAQPNACPVCGPRLWLTDAHGQTLAEQAAALESTAELLRAGNILAIKGLGGFHLVCDARNQQAVDRLRQRKNRQDKPLAIMVPNLETARTLCALSAAEEDLLYSRSSPIVLARAKPDTGLAPGLSPDTDVLGLMLPYTPLHHVLFAALSTSSPAPALVMTSGNRSSEPICLGNREALRRLSAIADFFLLHDRDILIRCDDSVLRMADSAPLFFRRARGFTPAPIDLHTDGPTVLGVGAQLKNTLCLTKGGLAFVSQHIGDLDNLESFVFFQETLAHMQDILRIQPVAAVHDLHPDFLSTDFARTSTLPCLPLQHHYAHIHAVLAETRHVGPAIGLALDGTGLGDDGTLWGGEALLTNTQTLYQKRLASFSQIRLPGGDQAVREPWRIARAFFHALNASPQGKVWPWLPRFAQADSLVGQMLERGLNAPLSSSCGRLFDAVAALLGLCQCISYEGQAAIKLEAIQDKSENRVYACPVRDGELMELDTLTLFDQVWQDWERGESPSRISRRFHLGLVAGLTNLCVKLADNCSCPVIALSGGVMQNLTLARHLPHALRQHGLLVLEHRQLPPNDACISLGQAAYGRLVWKHNPEMFT